MLHSLDQTIGEECHDLLAGLERWMTGLLANLVGEHRMSAALESPSIAWRRVDLNGGERSTKALA